MENELIELPDIGEKGFSELAIGVGYTIGVLANAYKKLFNAPNFTFGEACGVVIGLSLDLPADHDNRADMFQAAEMLKAYARKVNRPKFMIQ